MKVGTIVLDPSHWNWLDPDVLSWRVTNGLDLAFLAHITDVRRAVEPIAASLAAQNRTRADIVKLREAVADMGHAKEDRRLFAQADLRFHLAVSLASRNPFFQSFAGIIETALSTMLSINALADNSRMQSRTVATHAAVADAIAAGHSERAAAAMLRTVQDGFAHAKRARGKKALKVSRA
jgi:DNA-binding FadR family transcriptional regulator